MSDGQLISSEPVALPNVMRTVVTKLYSQDVLEHTLVNRITYLSDGLQVHGYYARPVENGNYPVLIWNRGGYGERGALNDLRAYLLLASTAIWGYVVLATQYRGNMGSEGEESWGDKDVHDSLNLLKLAERLPECDMSRVAVEGASRGGMTTYRMLTMRKDFRCAIVHAGVADLFALEQSQREFARFLEKMFGHLSLDERRYEYSKRSAVYFAEKFPDHCPLLLLHGTADRQVPVSQSERLAKELSKYNKPHKLVLIEGGGHVALQDGSYKEIDIYRKKWLAQHLRGNSRK